LYDDVEISSMTGVVGRGDESAAFVSALADLDEEGAAFLVVGDVPTDVHGVACERLLGSSADRECVRVQTGETPLVDREGEHTVAFDASVRSAAVADAGGTADRPEVTASLSELGVATVREIGDAEPSGDDSLRVCVEPLTPLRATYDDEALFRFLHLLAGRVRQSGRLHVHLPAPPDSVEVALFRDLFDGVVELRVADGEIQQRWHLDEADVSSSWVTLD
jgi:hypothetical protein